MIIEKTLKELFKEADLEEYLLEFELIAYAYERKEQKHCMKQYLDYDEEEFLNDPDRMPKDQREKIEKLCKEFPEVYKVVKDISEQLISGSLEQCIIRLMFKTNRINSLTNSATGIKYDKLDTFFEKTEEIVGPFFKHPSLSTQ